MPIQQLYRKDPAVLVSTGMTMGLPSGRATGSVSQGMRTALRHSLSTARVNSSAAGLPTVSLTSLGSNPSLVTLTANFVTSATAEEAEFSSDGTGLARQPEAVPSTMTATTMRTTGRN